MLDEIREYRRKKSLEIGKHKWIASEKAGLDLGDKAHEEWLIKHEPDFRKYWLENRFDLAC